MAGGAETPNIAALPAIARLGTCESARGPDADRHVKLLIQFAVEGSLSGAYSHRRNERGPQMTIETIAFLVFVFSATTLAAMAHERRMDVLYGPYLEGRAGGHVRLSTERFWKPMHSAADRLRWKARGMVYLASAIAC
jgi:hypothetical protein